MVSVEELIVVAVVEVRDETVLVREVLVRVVAEVVEVVVMPPPHAQHSNLELKSASS